MCSSSIEVSEQTHGRWKNQEQSGKMNIMQNRREKLRLKKLAKRENQITFVILQAYNYCNYRKCKKDHQVKVSFIWNGYSSYKSPPCVYNIHDTKHAGNRIKTIRTCHEIQVGHDYLTKLSNLGFYTFNNCLIIDAKSKGFSENCLPVYEIKIIRQSKGFDLTNDTVRISFHPIVGGATEIQEYYGKTIKRKRLCQMLGIGTDTPDCAIVDKYKEL